MENYWRPEIETIPLEEMKKLQSKILVENIKRIYNDVPFYKDLMDKNGVTPDDIKSIDDLEKLPFTYKQDLRDNYPYGLFAKPMEEIVRVHASSGTTGKQTVVGYTENDIKIWSDCAARALVSVGGTPKDFVHVSYGYGLFTGGLGMHYGAEELKATAIPASIGNTNRQIQILKDFKSSILCCTPSYAMFLADTMKEMGVDKSEISLKAGLFGAEPWTNEMRLEIEDRLGIKAYDIYGLSEIMGPGVSFECSEQTGMHVNEDYFFIEIVDPDTKKPLPDGEYGEIVFTAVSKEALPLIRYNTKDVGSISRKPCSCGRTLVKMSKPQGRTDDMLIIRGVNVFPSQIESVLLKNGELSPHYMIIVDRKDNLDTMEIMVEINENTLFDTVREMEKMEKTLTASVQSVLGIKAKVKLVEPRTIERFEGKAKRVIDNRKLY